VESLAAEMWKTVEIVSRLNN